MASIFTTLFYQPLFNVLIFFYNIVPGHDIGLAIIALTLLIKAILYPFSRQAIKAQKSLQTIQPKIDEVKRRLKDDKEAQAKEMMQLYKDEKVNPFSSCLPLLVQFPFFIAVFQVFRTGLNSENFSLLYPFVANPGQLQLISLGFIDLAKPSIPLAIAAGLAQFWQARMMSTKRPPKAMPGAKDEDMMAMMNKQMLYMMPAMTVFIGIGLPGGLTLYWLVFTTLTALQQLFMFRKKPTTTVTTPAST